MSGMFTTNKVKAAPVKIDLKRIRSGRGQAIIANSGNANACTGMQGLADAAEMTSLVSKGLKLKENMVFVCSTGVIGARMPMDRIRPKVHELVAGLGKSTMLDAASAIMTTDTFAKKVSKRIKIGDSAGTISGICKGAGMIRPDMATMLCFIVTDLDIERSALDTALRDAVRKSFNRLTIDGDMSTNDTVLIMANGMAGNDLIRSNLGDFRAFSSALFEVAYELSRMIAADGEGATKLAEIEVKHARNEGEAEKAAFAIANSLLVKTALFGSDANWGRIMGALGASGISVAENKVDIYFGRIMVAKNGLATGKDKKASETLRKKKIKITVDLHLGKGASTVLTCDLSEGYVRINAEYRT